MDSHLGGGSPLGNQSAAPGSNIRRGKQMDDISQGMGDRPHGTVVNASQIHRHEGGAWGNLEGAANMDPRAQMDTEVYASPDIKTCEGSNTQVFNRDLPENDAFGHGQTGTGQIYSASELETVDQQHATHKNLQPLQPGAYQLKNGNILVVQENNERRVITPQQWNTLQARFAARQAATRGPTAGLLGAVSRAVRR